MIWAKEGRGEGDSSKGEQVRELSRGVTCEGGGAKEGGGRPERSCTNCLVASQRLPIIARRLREASGERNQ